MNIVHTKIAEPSQSLRGTAPRRIGPLLMLCGAVTLVAAAGATAVAAPPEAPSITVQYEPWSLDSDRGANALYRRIASAAAGVCPAASPRELARFAATERCRKDAIARAVRQIGSPRLAEVLAARTSRG